MTSEASTLVESPSPIEMADRLMRWQPVVTSWDAFRRDPGEVAALVAELKAMGALPSYARPHEEWVLQQRLRLALFKQNGSSPAAADIICDECGLRPAEVFGCCLECAEFSRQTIDSAGNGITHFDVGYHLKTGTWGLFFSESFSGSGCGRSEIRHAISFGYPVRRDAVMALNPVVAAGSFHRIRQARGIYLPDIFPLHHLRDMTIEGRSFSPSEFHVWLRDQCVMPLLEEGYDMLSLKDRVTTLVQRP